MCLLPYRQGYHLDVYTTFTIRSGGVSAQALGYSLARAIVGDSSRFIPRVVNRVLDAVQATGASVELVESYPE